MLNYITTKDFFEKADRIEDPNIRQFIKDTAATMLKSTKRVYLSTLEYTILGILERQEGTIEELLNEPAQFFNKVDTWYFKNFIEFYKEEIDFYMKDCLASERYCPSLPDYFQLEHGTDGLIDYVFFDVLPEIYRYLLNE